MAGEALHPETAVEGGACQEHMIPDGVWLLTHGTYGPHTPWRCAVIRLAERIGNPLILKVLDRHQFVFAVGTRKRWCTAGRGGRGVQAR